MSSGGLVHFPHGYVGLVDVSFERVTTAAEDAVGFLSGDRPVTLIITFELREDAPVERFVALCTDIGSFMALRPGFISARLYRARGSTGRDYIQFSNWSQANLLAEAQAQPEVRRMERAVRKLTLRQRLVLCDPSTDELLPSHVLT